MPSITDILEKINNQDFGRNDSTIVSSMRHPIKAAGLAGKWLQDQVNNAAGTGIPYDEANPFYAQDSRKQEAALNLAGMANLGGMPFAERSAGGTLGTITGWHGSPHDFDRFDSSKIGSGEGAQAFGYGHYITDSPEIGEYYKDVLTGNYHHATDKKKIYIDDMLQNTHLEGHSSYDDFKNAEKKIGLPTRAMEIIYNNNGDLNKAISKVKSHVDEYKKLGEDVSYYENILNKLNNFDSKRIIKNDDGHLYKVSADVEKEHLLDWDKPLSEQSDFVKSKLKPSNRTGEDFISALEKTKGNQKEAAEILKKIGIKGVIYKANEGRSKSNNYVIFDDKDLEIKNKYKSLTDAMGK